MPDTERFKFKSEQMGIAAIVIAIISGGGGVGVNMSSNATVLKKLEDVTIGMVKIEASIKSNDEGRVRLEVKMDKHEDAIEKLRTEYAELKQRVAVLEAKK